VRPCGRRSHHADGGRRAPAGCAAGAVVWENLGPMDERFRFRPEVLRAAASRTRRRVLASAVATAAAAAALWGVVLRPRGGGPGALAFALALLGLLALLSLRRRLRRLHARWSSFEVALRDDGIARTVDGFPPIAIARAEVSGVEERPTGLVVRGARGAALLVPREVEGYERVRALVAAWAPSFPAS
jgi:hypothetical protein